MNLIPILLSIAPVFLLIILGNVLRRNGIPNVEFWNLNDKLVYWVLMPALLFYKTSMADVSLNLLGGYTMVLLGGFFAALFFALITCKLLGIEGPPTTSVMQGAARHNSFVGLSIAERLFGMSGLSLAALVVSILIPVTNIAVVSFMVLLNGTEGTGNLFTRILRDLVRNPLILSVVGGSLFNLGGVGEIPILHETLYLLGSAALPIVLLCVGANLRIGVMQAAPIPIALSIVGKFAVFPIVTLALALAVGLSEVETSVAMLFCGGSTASAAYTLARQMGGDAPLMAAIATIQTGLAFLLLPAWLLLTSYVFGM